MPLSTVSWYLALSARQWKVWCLKLFPCPPFSVCFFYQMGLRSPHQKQRLVLSIPLRIQECMSPLPALKARFSSVSFTCAYLAKRGRDPQYHRPTSIGARTRHHACSKFDSLPWQVFIDTHATLHRCWRRLCKDLEHCSRTRIQVNLQVDPSLSGLRTRSVTSPR